MLKVEHVTKYYDDFRAVNDVSFEIKEGEIFGLLGVNGAGKTTTFRMIMGLLDMTEGNITLDGNKIDYSVTDKIGFLTEERSLLPTKTVLEQAIYYGVLKGLTEKEVERMLKLEDKKIPEDIDYDKVNNLASEARQKLKQVRPLTIAQATRISGVNPADISILTVYLKKEYANQD